MVEQTENTDEALQASVRITRDARREISSQVQSLNARIDQIGSSWEGQGALAFGRVRAAWNNQVHRLMTALDEFGDSLEVTDQKFNAAEDDVAGAMSHLSARLG
jgi:WXG100 family type VII secretion target